MYGIDRIIVFFYILWAIPENNHIEDFVKFQALKANVWSKKEPKKP